MPWGAPLVWREGWMQGSCGEQGVCRNREAKSVFLQSLFSVSRLSKS